MVDRNSDNESMSENSLTSLSSCIFLGLFLLPFTIFIIRSIESLSFSKETHNLSKAKASILIHKSTPNYRDIKYTSLKSIRTHGLFKSLALI